MYNFASIITAIGLFAAKRSIALTPFQIIRVAFIMYMVYNSVRGKKLFEGNIFEWKYKKILISFWFAFSPFGAYPVKKAVSRKYFIPLDDLNFLENVFQKLVIDRIIPTKKKRKKKQ